MKRLIGLRGMPVSTCLRSRCCPPLAFAAALCFFEEPEVVDPISLSALPMSLLAFFPSSGFSTGSTVASALLHIKTRGKNNVKGDKEWVDKCK